MFTRSQRRFNILEEPRNDNNNSIKPQNIRNIVTTSCKTKKHKQELPCEDMCGVITRSQRRSKILEEVQNVVNNSTKSQNLQNTVNTRCKTVKHKQELPCEDTCGVITRSQRRSIILAELQNVANNSTKSENVEDIVTTKTEKRIKEFACEYPGCTAIYDRPFRLKRHIRLHTGERPYKCDNLGCDKRYSAPSHLKRHAQTHNRVKKGLQCNQCFLIVSNYNNLRRHYKRVHTNPLRCKECYAQFKKKYHLALHMNVHLGTTTHKCSQCNKSFINSLKLQRHEKCHEKKIFHCPEQGCSEVFDKWTLFRKHKAQHNVFKCHICGKEYKRSGTLKVHSKTHTEHTFSCPYDTCNRKYKMQFSLTNHINIRHLDQKFICDMCKKSFTAKHSLKNHILSIHMGVEVRKKKIKKSVRKRRKDAGIPKKSMVTMLAGLKFIHHTDKELLKRESVIKLTA